MSTSERTPDIEENPLVQRWLDDEDDFGVVGEEVDSNGLQGNQ